VSEHLPWPTVNLNASTIPWPALHALTAYYSSAAATSYCNARVYGSTEVGWRSTAFRSDGQDAFKHQGNILVLLEPNRLQREETPSSYTAVRCCDMANFGVRVTRHVLGFLDRPASSHMSQIFFCDVNDPLSLGGKIMGGRLLASAARGRCLRRRWRLADRRIVTR
jgi:hypothetical protein